MLNRQTDPLSSFQIASTTGIAREFVHLPLLNMGLSYSCLGAGAGSADGTTPEDLGTAGNHDARQGEHHKGEEDAAASDPTPAPSVVIAWVQNDVFISPLSGSDDEKLKRDAQYEAHAERLRRCWATHAKDFPQVFANELMACVQGVSSQCHGLRS